MKFLLPIFFLLANQAFAQTPDYFSNNPKWRCSIWNSNQWTPPFTPEWEHFVYYINGDTLIASQTYHQIHRRGYRDYDFNPYPVDEYFDEPTGLYVRQSGRAIYFYDTDQGQDSLLIDYDKSVGDTFEFQAEGCLTNTDTIQHIDSVLVNGEYRHVFYIDTASGPVITEGIGHQSFVDFDEGHSLFPWCIGLGHSYVISCFGFNEDVFWTSDPNANPCYLSVGIEEETEEIPILIQNPVRDFIQIPIDLNSQDKLFLLDMNGRIALQSAGNSTVDVRQLASGIYTLYIQYSTDNYSRAKVLIQH